MDVHVQIQVTSTGWGGFGVLDLPPVPKMSALGCFRGLIEEVDLPSVCGITAFQTHARSRWI
jgi:hypothetical protein